MASTNTYFLCSPVFLLEEYSMWPESQLCAWVTDRLCLGYSQTVPGLHTGCAWGHRQALHGLQTDFALVTDTSFGLQADFPWAIDRLFLSDSP